MDVLRKTGIGDFAMELRAYIGFNNVFTLPDDRVRIYDEVQKVKDTGFSISLIYAL
jgi:hypothetical protein